MRGPALGTALFLLLVTSVEVVVAPWLLTGFERGEGALDAPAVAAVGVALMVAGALLLVWTLTHVVAEGRGTPSPVAPPTALVVGGPFRVVRHPMYLATATVIAGEGLLLARPVLLIAAVAYLAAFALYTRFAEEPQLARRFGADWERYARQTPGWIPRMRRARPGKP